MLTEDCLVLKCHFQILNSRDWSLEPLCRQPCEIMSSRTEVINMLMMVGNLRVNKVGSWQWNAWSDDYLHTLLDVDDY